MSLISIDQFFYKNNDMNHKKSPLISIIIPVYNRANVICNAIDSALKQSYRNIEIIVVDDCSTDNTLEIVKQYGDKIIVIRHTENLHVSAARNTGMNKAQGEYIAFLDSDDEWYDNKIELQISFMQEHNYEISCTNFVSYYLNERGIEQKNRPYSEINLEDCLWGIYFAPGSTLLINKNILKKIGGYNIKYKRIEDWELFIRILSSGYKIGFLQKCTTKIISSNNITIYNLEIYCNMLLKDSYEILNFLNKNYFQILKAGVYFELAVTCWKMKSYFKSLIYLLKSFYFKPLNHKSVKIILLPWLKNKLRLNFE